MASGSGCSSSGCVITQRVAETVVAETGDLNPFLSSRLFVGRDKQLVQLTRLLRQGQSTLLVGGRRAGKTTLARHLSSDTIARALVFTDVAGWDLTSEATALGGLRSAVEAKPESMYDHATRNDLVSALDAIGPVALVLDEADRVLLAPWAASFYSFLRWLDDTYLRGDIAILLIGGPVLAQFKDPEDRGSPPLNTAELRYMEPLDREAVAHLASLTNGADREQTMKLGGGQAWLTTRLLAEVWDGATLDEAAETVFDRALGTFRIWERQLGAGGRNLLHKIPPGGLPRQELRRAPWSQHREAARFGQCVGALRFDGDRLCHGPQLFIDWLGDQDPDDLVWDIAISYASEDQALARQIYSQMRDDFKVFFAPEESAALWGADLNRVLPNTYGVQSRFVLVLSTHDYMVKYWTRMEYNAIAAKAPNRILLLDLGELPTDLPPGLVYRGGSAGELVGLIGALRKKLASLSVRPSTRVHLGGIGGLSYLTVTMPWLSCPNVAHRASTRARTQESAGWRN